MAHDTMYSVIAMLTAAVAKWSLPKLGDDFRTFKQRNNGNEFT